MRVDFDDVLTSAQVVRLSVFGAEIHAITAAMFSQDHDTAKVALDRLRLPLPDTLNNERDHDSRRAWKAYLADLMTQAATALRHETLEDACRK